MNIIPRGQWQDPKLPVTGPVMRLSTIQIIPAHYTAMATTPDNTPALLRSIQRDYKTNRHYSIGYNFAIDEAGLIWECRGWDIKCAANAGHNEEAIAILCLVDGAQPLNQQMATAFRWLGAECQRRVGHKLIVLGHRDIGKTACPGNGIYAQIVAGQLEPADPITPPLVPEEDEEMAFIISNRDTGQPALVYGDGKVTGLTGDGLHEMIVRFGAPLVLPPEVFDDFASKGTGD